MTDDGCAPPSRIGKIGRWAPRQNEAWLRQLIAAHRENGRRATAFIAHDVHWQPDMGTLRRLTPHYRAYRRSDPIPSRHYAAEREPRFAWTGST